MPPRTRKTAEVPTTTTGTEATHPLRALFLDLAEVFTKHANSLPLTLGRDSTVTIDASSNGVAPDETETSTEAEVIEPAAETPKPATRGRKATKAAAPKQREAEPVAEEPGEAEALTAEQYRAQLQDMELEELRALAISMQWDPKDVNGASAEDIIEALVDDQYGGDTEAEANATGEVEEVVEESTESNGVTREELLEMSLPVLRKFAKQIEMPEDQIKGLDIEALADAILAFQENGGEEEAEGEDEGEGLTVEQAENMSRAELWDIVTTPEVDGGLGYNPPKNAGREQLLGWVVAAITGEDPQDPPY